MSFGEYQSNESFPDNLEAKHPEQVTLYSLLEKITQLTDLDVSHESWEGPVGRSVKMHEVPESLAETKHAARQLSVTRFYIPQDPDRLASITQTERIGEGYDRLLTKYDVENSPDGLQIEKHMKIVDISADGLVGFVPRNPELVIRELERRAEEARRAHTEEAETGLNFVSEAEARELIRMLYDDFTV